MGFFKDKTEKLMREIAKLETTEFLGVCKILNIPLYEKVENTEVDVEETVDARDCDESARNAQEQSLKLDKDGKPDESIYGRPREFKDIWGDLCEKVNHLNREQKRNLDKLVRAATKKGN